MLDAVAQADAVRRRDASPQELVGDAIDRIQSRDGEINAVVIPLFEDAAARAAGELPDGPLRGVPIVVKDLGCAGAGQPHHAGMRVLRDASWTESEDSAVMSRLKASGAVVVGRTNTPELGLGVTTEPVAYGPTRNPWDLTRSPGGSSGGSAAAVAAGHVGAAHGSDGGGSIRIPASMCGLVGLKPTRGLVPDDRSSFDFGHSVHGVLSRSVRDAAVLLGVMSGRDIDVSPRAGLRIGVMQRQPRSSGGVDAECVRAVDDAAGALDSIGHAVEDAHPPALDDEELPRHHSLTVAVDAAHRIESWALRTGLPISIDDVEPTTQLLARIGQSVSSTQLLASLVWLDDFSRRLRAWWEEGGFDLLLTPTLPELPPALGEVHTPADPALGLLRGAPFTAFTAPFNISGQPAVSVPTAHTTGGLPVGVQVVGGIGAESMLLGVAQQLEDRCPWAQRVAGAGARRSHTD